MSTGPMTVQILSLRCVQAQEIDGDEIYLTAGQYTIWSTGIWRMSERLVDSAQIDEADFVNGRIHTKSGWSPMHEFDPGAFTIPVGEGVLIRVLERDLLIGDDVLGQVEVLPRDEAHGQIQVAFTAEGAHYLLNYEVKH